MKQKCQVSGWFKFLKCFLVISLVGGCWIGIPLFAVMSLVTPY